MRLSIAKLIVPRFPPAGSRPLSGASSISAAASYQQIGWPAMIGGYFETDAALEVGRRVAAEVAAARSARKQGS
jgi:hypothetical protein